MLSRISISLLGLLFIFTIVAKAEANSSEVNLSLSLNQSRKVKVPLPEVFSSKDFKVELDLSSLQKKDELGFVKITAQLSGTDLVPRKELLLSVKTEYGAPSFSATPLSIKIINRESSEVQYTISLNLTVRAELVIALWGTENEAFWDSPKEIFLASHPQGLQIRLVNRSLEPLEKGLRIHMQSGKPLQHSETYESLSEPGAEYSYFLTNKQMPSKIEYRCHYREGSQDLRTIYFNTSASELATIVTGSQEDF